MLQWQLFDKKKLLHQWRRNYRRACLGCDSTKCGTPCTDEEKFLAQSIDECLCGCGDLNQCIPDDECTRGASSQSDPHVKTFFGETYQL